MHSDFDPDISEAVLDALDAALSGRARLEKAVERTLRAHRRWTNAERALFARRTQAISVLRGRLDYLARAAGAGRVGARELLAVYLLAEEGQLPGVAASVAGVGGSPGWLTSLAGRLPDWPSDPVERLAAECSLPAWLARLWSHELGGEGARSLALAMNAPAGATLRANTLLVDRDRLRTRLAEQGIETEPGALASTALHVRGRANLFGSDAWRAGEFEVQDEGSQLIVEACAARPGQLVVDYCAGAGGKTLGLAAAMKGEGRLVACDVDARRLADLRPRLARAHVKNVEPRLLGSPDAVANLSGQADVVLVDAPCSSLGTLRRSPEARWTLTDDDLARFPPVQSDILARASALVRPGGRLVYATCTVRRAENEDIADRLGPGWEPVRPHEGIPGTRFLLRPDVHGTDGFFVAAWRRR